MELAKLKGSEKQVSWAKAIRTDRLKVWQASDPSGFQGVELKLTQQDSASWWITSKDKSLRDICGRLQGGAKPKTPSKKAAPGVAKAAGMKGTGIPETDDEAWETVVTAAGFMRTGPTRDEVTGEIVKDATLPF